MFSDQKEANSLRGIKTARDEKSINEAAQNGFFPLLKRVEKSESIKSKYAVLQNKKTGEIEVIGDFRGDFGGRDYDMVIDFTFYYPHNFPSPFAAYLIPRDIKVGERVCIEDLIEDFIGVRWNQGDTYRLESCEAIWNGKDFDIQYDANQCADFIG
ncbi:hypothetical protein GO003_023515 [Methylicorpusculum oleiharenae]|uniref:hypothetical protein n=1 Tax=Methylicorpusculum oleiharenae TaxID=1338687 RepID=UPI0013581013|nr:hypothetical protein [Methylicorpusculum oleiharenae]MCD2453353.1 hypothetical protein [Methylicorpusculum oleiharenae]